MVKQTVTRPHTLPAGTRIWLIGVALVVTGIACLCLSYLVAPQGSWWQGTLDAFGVGFVIGGIVDGVSMNLLADYMSRSAREREEVNAQATELVASRWNGLTAAELREKWDGMGGLHLSDTAQQDLQSKLDMVRKFLDYREDQLSPRIRLLLLMYGSRLEGDLRQQLGDDEVKAQQLAEVITFFERDGFHISPGDGQAS